MKSDLLNDFMIEMAAALFLEILFHFKNLAEYIKTNEMVAISRLVSLRTINSQKILLRCGNMFDFIHSNGLCTIGMNANLVGRM